MRNPPIDYERMAPRYDRGRDLPSTSLDAWRVALANFLPTEDGLPLLDLGSGTGLWSGMLAGWFGVRVVAVEPSAGMQREALRRRRMG